MRKKHCDKQKSFCGPFWKLKCWAGSYVFEIFFSKWKMVLRVSVKPSPSLSPIDNWLWDQLRAILNQKSLKPEGCFIGLEYNGMTFADVSICIILFFFENKVVSCTRPGWIYIELNFPDLVKSNTSVLHCIVQGWLMAGGTGTICSL